jgi:hypothetical protein
MRAIRAVAKMLCRVGSQEHSWSDGNNYGRDLTIAEEFSGEE